MAGSSRNGPELRRKPRRQFHYDARILKDRDTPLVSCLISDISDSGARLNLETATELPDTFVLLLTPNGGARRNCRVVWRNGTSVGVKFPDIR